MDVVATSDDGAPSKFPGVDRARLISTRRRTIIIRIITRSPQLALAPGDQRKEDDEKSQNS
jgi:hypothetical protein